jgi:NADH dehydrogenase
VLEPVRRLGLDAFHEAQAERVDFAAKKVWLRPFAPVGDDASSAAALSSSAAAASSSSSTSPAYAVGYDSLVVAVGAHPQTFNIPGVARHANLLRTATDARRIRLRILALLERAARPDISDALRRHLLHFAVVGGGPTGVEFAAELHDLVREDLPRLYPSLAPLVTVSVYDVAPTVLPMFERDLARYATELFRRQDIRVHTEASILEIVPADEHEGASQEEKEAGLLRLRIREKKAEHGAGDEAVAVVPAGIVVWSTGLAQNPLLARLDGVKRDVKTGGLLTDERLRVLSEGGGDNGGGAGAAIIPDVYAIGDCSVVDGQRYPATAQVASQQAVYLGRVLNKRATAPSSSPSSSTADDTPPKNFKFRNLGTMAYLGSWRAIHQSSADELKGRAAWLLWRTAYLTKSMSVRNKIMVPVYWFMTWVFGRDVSRF